MSVIVRNQAVPGACLVSTDVESDPQYGRRFIQRYKGDSVSINNLEVSFRSAGWRTTLLHTGPAYTLDVSIGDSGQISGELPEEAFDIYNWRSEFTTMPYAFNPRVQSDPVAQGNAGSIVVGSCTDEQLKIIEAAAKHFRAGEQSQYDTERDKLEPGGSAANALAVAVLDIVVLGVESTEVRRPTLSRVRTYSTAYATRQVHEVVPIVWTSQQLINTYGLPTAVQNQMPLTPPNKPKHTIWGWKIRDQENETIPQIGRIVETITWTFSAWDTVQHQSA